MNSETPLRRATLRDLHALRRIRREAISQLAAPTLGVDEALGWANSAEPDRERRAIEEHVVAVAEVDQQPIGWVETLHDRVEGLYVDPEHAQRGVGKRLMQHAENLMREAGYMNVHLHASRNAGDFYRALGFRSAGPEDPKTGLPMMKSLW